MRLLLLFLCSIIPLLSNAQADNVNARTGLSKPELELGKKLFVEMMHSETYVQMNKSVRRLNEKTTLMDNDMSEIKALKTREDVKNLYRKWLKENLQETKFKSVEEGLKYYMETLDLTEKNIKENAELFALLRKATSGQFREIMEPQRLADRERLLGGS